MNGVPIASWCLEDERIWILIVTSAGIIAPAALDEMESGTIGAEFFTGVRFGSMLKWDERLEVEVNL